LETERTQLLSSSLAIEEARRNLMEDRPDKLPDLKNLLNDVETVTEPAGLRLTEVALLPPKDRPILLAAVHARATHLLTGDRRHFGECFGKTVAGVLVLTPGEYLKLRR
jgi:uncharacterized protein